MPRSRYWKNSRRPSVSKAAPSATAWTNFMGILRCVIPCTECRALCHAAATRATPGDRSAGDTGRRARYGWREQEERHERRTGTPDSPGGRAEAAGAQGDTEIGRAHV